MEYSVSTLKANTIQAATGTTVNVASGHKISAAQSGIVAPGMIIKTEQTVLQGTNSSTSSTSYVSTVLTCNFTPTYATSKVLFTGSFGLFAESGYSTYATLYRDSTHLASDSTHGMIRIFSTSGAEWQRINLIWLDNPSTTSEITYTIYFKVSGGTGYIHGSDTKSTLTVQEIAQ
jgi:hypothetical protein